MSNFELGSSPEKVKLGTLNSGERVIDRPSSHLHKNEVLDEYLPRALERISSGKRDFLVEAVDFGEIIGETNCVVTTDSDDIVFAERPLRNGLTRFVKNRTKVPTSELTVVLRKEEDKYVALTAFLGPKAEKEPWDTGATEASKVFWETHALVFGSEEIVPGSETTELPHGWN